MLGNPGFPARSSECLGVKDSNQAIDNPVILKLWFINNDLWGITRKMNDYKLHREQPAELECQSLVKHV